MAVALLFGASVFFKIKEIKIKIDSAGKYTEEEILAAAEVEVEQNLLFMRKSSVAAKIREVLPYVESVNISKSYPSTLTISIDESRTAAVIEREVGGYYKLNREGKILEEITKLPEGEIIEIRGLIAAEVYDKKGKPVSMIGEVFETPEGSSLEHKYTLKILDMVFELEMEERVTWIDIAEAGDLKLGYDGRFTVELGTAEDLENKIGLAERIAREAGPEKTGRIIVKDQKTASLVPDGAGNQGDLNTSAESDTSSNEE